MAADGDPVLVIENDPAAAGALARLLREGGAPACAVLAETDAELALARLADTRVRCVVLDLSLARHGAQVFLSRLGAPMPLPIVAVTGPCDESLILAAAECGVQTLLPAQGLTESRLQFGIAQAMRGWQAHQAAPADAAASAERRRVLIVDDSELDRRIVARILRAESLGRFEVAHAVSGRDGLQRLRDDAFDCVLLDYELADMTGLDFLREAAAPGGVQRAAIVVMTGQGSESIAVEALHLGALDYRVKDRDQDLQIGCVIDRAIEQKRLRRRLAQSLCDLSAANLAFAEEVATRERAEAAARAARDAAEQANRAKSRFVALVSHELRTPLNAILGYTKLLGLDGNLSPEQAVRVEVMARAGSHLLHLIERVLDFSAIEAGRVELRPERFRLDELARACVELVMPGAQEKGLDLRLVADTAAPTWLEADLGRLRQVIINLLGNAAKFTARGAVTLRLQPGPDGGALIEVIDEGRGVPPEKTGLLFNEFERLNPLDTTEGAGLGLAISRRFVRLMGGDITYRPNPMGGSIFAVTLPAALCTAPPEGAAADAALHVMTERSATPLHILVVDDFEPNRDVVGAFLRAAGHSVAYAQDGLEAVEAAACGTFDAILMDVLMPRMGGIEATQRIRALPAPAGQVPIVALSAQAFREHVEDCGAAGMDAHCSKPLDFDRLLPTILRVVQARESGVAPAGPASAAAPAEAAPVAAAPAAPKPAASQVFDPAAFREIAHYMEPERLRACLDGLGGAMKALTGALREEATERQALRDMSHTLAGSAGTFGFKQLSLVARGFSRALDDMAPGGAAPDRQPLREALHYAASVLARLRGETATP